MVTKTRIEIALVLTLIVGFAAGAPAWAAPGVSGSDSTGPRAPVSSPAPEDPLGLPSLEKFCDLGEPPTKEDDSTLIREYCSELRKCLVEFFPSRGIPKKGKLRESEPGIEPGLGPSQPQKPAWAPVEAQMYLSCLRKYLPKRAL